MNVLKLFVDCIKKKAFIKSVEGHIKKAFALNRHWLRRKSFKFY